MAKRRKPPSFGQMAGLLEGKLRPPFGIVLGAPNAVTDLVAGLPAGDVTCYQMDLYQAARLRESLAELGLRADVATAPDLWDLPARFQTLLYPVPLGGERALKLDMIEQAYHALAERGTFVVLSPYEKDEFFPQALKKVFGKVHSPMAGHNAVLWCQRGADRPRRRHEMTFQVRVDDDTSYRFVTRPGAFSYGKFDEGARALTEVMRIEAGDRIADVGCGVGTNGILAARRAGPGGFVTFADSNVRAVALTELNAKNLAVCPFEAVASHTMRELANDSYEVALANPPYFAQMTIAALFIQRGKLCLKPGGRFFLVTKQTEHITPLMEEAFGDVEAVENRGYVVYMARKPRGGRNT
jgi:16S rRNA (guanine1207-N2)-methyltransferase